MKVFEFAGPTFNAVVKSARAGDFLGMGPVGERLYGQVFPGLNNNVRYPRAYAAICWAVDQAYAQATSGESTVIDVPGLIRSATRLLDKVQLLLAWQAAVHSEKLVPGMSAFKEVKGALDLTLQGWKVKTTFMSGLYYLPGLVGGFGLVNRGTGRAKNTYSCSPAGKLLAKAFDNEVCQLSPSARKWLLSTENITCDKKRLASLKTVVTLGQPSASERSTFRRLFLYGVVENKNNVPDPNKKLREKNARKRRQSVVLALRSLEALDAEKKGFASVEDIRQVMSAGYAPSGTKLDLSGVETSWREWHVLQIRQLQRLAMEVLLGLVERIILAREQTKQPSFKSDICAAMRELICESKSKHIVLGKTVGSDIAWYKREQKKYPTLQAAGVCGSQHKVFLNISELKMYLRGKPLKADPADMDGTYLEWATAGKFAVNALVYCAVEVENLRGLSKGHRNVSQNVEKLLSFDGDKLSLSQLAQVVTEFQDKPPSEFVIEMVGWYVIEQHFRTATTRSELASDGQNRFVFTQEHHGLSRWREGRSDTFIVAQEAHDILLNVLLLLEGCGCLQVDFGAGSQGEYYRNTRFKFLAEGRKLLKEASAALQ
jgi:hypothetical protein